MAIAAPLPQKMTFEEFLDWALRQERRVEWVDGEVKFMSPVSDAHQEINQFLLMALGYFVQVHQLGRVYDQTFVMKLSSRPSGREPDIMFVATEHHTRIQKNHLEGPADLVIEIVSPDDPARDRQTKLAEYEQGGVREYWLIDPLQNEAIFYQLQSGETYHIVPADMNGIYHSREVQGFWINVNWLWRHPMTLLQSVYGQLELI